MRGFLIELAKTGGRIARDHFRSHRLRVTVKGRNDYVSHVDRMVEDAIVTRIRAHFPSHAIIGEESAAQGQAPLNGPCWIIDPIDGTTNFIRGIAHFGISIAFCENNGIPRHGVVYDPIADEMFIAERDAGLWVGRERVYSSGCKDLAEALIATALPFRQHEPLSDAIACLADVQRHCQDFRRGGSCALDLAYVACGRLDAYFELGIWAWDTAAGELLVRCGGGIASDLHGRSDNLLHRRSLCAAASPELHKALIARLGPLTRWVNRDPYRCSAATVAENWAENSAENVAGSRAESAAQSSTESRATPT